MIEEMKHELNELKTGLNAVKSDVGTLKSDVGVLKSDVGVLKTDVGVLKSDVCVLKADVGVLKSDVSVLKEDVGVLKSDVSDLKMVTRRTAVTVTTLAGKMDLIIDRMATKDDISGLNRRMDAFAGMHEDMRYRWAIHAATLSEHDKRLTNLESKRP